MELMFQDVDEIHVFGQAYQPFLASTVDLYAYVK